MHRLFLAAAVLAAPASSAVAQSCCAPTTTFAPVAPTAVQTTAYSPVVVQQVQTTPWYPGRNLIEFTRDLFAPRTTVTAGYAPTYAAAPVATAPVAAPVTAYRTTYRPVYPVTYGPVVTGRTFVARPVVQTVARPVALAPVQVSACSPCSVCDTGCSACGVAQASFAAPASGCSSCAGGATTTYLDSAPAASVPAAEPQPALGPQDNPPAERSMLNRPEVPAFPEEADDQATDASGAFWEAPPLFDPSDRITRRGRVPASFAVQQQAVERPAASRPAPTPGGWVSASL